MKKGILIIIVLLSLQGVSQSLRHGKGNSGVHATFHLSEFGKAFSVGYTNYYKEKFVFKVKFNYESGIIGLTNYDSFKFFPTLIYTPFNYNNKLFLNLNGGILVGLEKQLALSENPEHTNLIYGGIVGAELEGFIINNVAVFGNYHQMYQIGSDFGKFRYQYGIGLRYYIK